MEDVTDIFFSSRSKCSRSTGVFFTEFTNSNSYCHPEGIKIVRGRLIFSEDEQPVVVHILVDNPEYFRQMSIGMAELKGIDINMGCPVPNVASRGKGSGLILRSYVAAELILAAKAGGLPVSVKTRLGYKDVNEWEEWLTHILKQDIANLSIHFTYKKGNESSRCAFELFPEIKKLRDHIAPNTLLTINGDIPDRQTGLQLVEQYDIDGVMMGEVFLKILLLLKKSPKSIAAKNSLIY